MRRVTARDVAELAGCSVSAVSLVVNGRSSGRINPVLLERITTAIRELGYIPNASARDLVTQKPSNIAFLCPDITNPFFGEVFKGVIRATDGRFGVDLRVQSHGEAYGPQTVSEVQVNNLAGLILAGPSSEVLENYVSTCPTLIIDAPSMSEGIASIELDLVSASRQLAEHLVGLGHREIVYIDLAVQKRTFELRYESLVETLAARGVRLSRRVEVATMTVASAQQAFAAHAEQWRADGVTAIVCADDVLAYGVVAGARAQGIDLPGQFSLASYNDVPYSRLLNPALTSVAFGALHVGETAGMALLKLIDGLGADHSMLPTVLMARESTASLR